MQRNSKPLPWRPKGLSDTLDSSTAFNGAMTSLQNLIPDPSTANVWQCRPAATKLFDFNTMGGPFSSGFSSGFQQGFFAGPAGFISVKKTIGNIVYGMIASSVIPGHDVPFAFNITTGTPIVVGGTVNATTTPVSPPSTGAWTPPQMALIGTKLMVTHSGFTGVGGNFVGWFDVTNPLAPVWNAGNLTGAIQFTVAPTGVVQFFNRAYYLYNLPAQPAVIFSDVSTFTNPGFATQVTNATQILTFGDNQLLTALGALPLSNQLGGIVQSVMVFKGVSNIFQITGDAALTSNPLSVNSLSVATGTLAPNSVCSTPKGLAFIAPDGVRIIDFNAQVSDPIGFEGKGITVPFIFSSVPSRMVAGCNGNVLRATTQNANVSGSPSQEYWYDFGRSMWISGPNTFPASLIEPYNNTFIMTPVGVNASLWQSDYVQSTTSTFVENGNQMLWEADTSLLPDTDMITNNAMTEGTIDLALPSNIGTVTIAAIAHDGNSLDVVTISSAAGAATIWGAFVWGAAPWGGGGASFLAPYELQWHMPIVFSRMSIATNGKSAAGVKVGALHMRYQILNQWTNTAAAA